MSEPERAGLKLLKFFDCNSESVDALNRIPSFFCQENNATMTKNGRQVGCRFIDYKMFAYESIYKDGKKTTVLKRLSLSAAFYFGQSKSINGLTAKRSRIMVTRPSRKPFQETCVKKRIPG
jgi:hypothetical protein